MTTCNRVINVPPLIAALLAAFPVSCVGSHSPQHSNGPTQDGTFDITLYTASLRIEGDTFTGRLAINGQVRGRMISDIFLDSSHLQIQSAVATTSAKHTPLRANLAGGDILRLHAVEPLTAGQWEIVIDYSGEVSETDPIGIFRRDRLYYYTQSEPNGARRIFPCVDRPNSKVPWDLQLEIAAHEQAVANAPLVGSIPLPNGFKRLQFARTRPLPPYLVAFAVGDFEAISASPSRDSRPPAVRVLVQRGHSITHSETAIADFATTTIITLADWFGVPFPYPKLDIVEVPKFGGVAMENPGLITLDEDIVPSDLDQESLSGALPVVGHELAHQWLGDLVSPSSWGDLWVSEGLAAWTAQILDGDGKIVFSNDPIVSSVTDLRTMEHRDQAAHTRTALTDQVREHGTVAYDYAWGASLADLFQAYVGRETFRRAIHKYLVSHADGIATVEDFSAEFGTDTGATHLNPTLNQFNEYGNVPELDISETCAETSDAINVSVADSRWEGIPFCIAYGDAMHHERVCSRTSSAKTTLRTAYCPSWIVPAGGVTLYLPKTPIEQLLGAALRAWKWLHNEEKAWLIAYSSRYPTQEARLLPDMLSDNDPEFLNAAIELLIRYHSAIDDSARKNVDRWLLSNLPQASTLTEIRSLADDSTDLLIIEMRAIAQDSSAVQILRSLLGRYKELGARSRRLLVVTSAQVDPKFLAHLYENVPHLVGEERANAVEALSWAPGITATILSKNAVFRALGLNEQIQLLTGSCQVSARPSVLRAAQMTREDAAVVGALFDRCASRDADVVRVLVGFKGTNPKQNR